MFDSSAGHNRKVQGPRKLEKGEEKEKDADDKNDPEDCDGRVQSNKSERIGHGQTIKVKGETGKQMR